MSYRNDIEAAWERVRAVPSRTFESSIGSVEYPLEGEGPPLLMSHGIQGSHPEGVKMVRTSSGPAGWASRRRASVISAQLCPKTRHRLFKPSLRRTPRPSRGRARGGDGLLGRRNIHSRAGPAPPRSSPRARPNRFRPTTVIATPAVPCPAVLRHHSDGTDPLGAQRVRAGNDARPHGCSQGDTSRHQRRRRRSVKSANRYSPLRLGERASSSTPSRETRGCDTATSRTSPFPR